MEQCVPKPSFAGGDVEIEDKVCRWSGGIFKKYLRNFIPFCNGEPLLTVVDKNDFYFTLIAWVNDTSSYVNMVVKR